MNSDWGAGGCSAPQSLFRLCEGRRIERDVILERKDLR